MEIVEGWDIMVEGRPALQGACGKYCIHRPGRRRVVCARYRGKVQPPSDPIQIRCASVEEAVAAELMGN